MPASLHAGSTHGLTLPGALAFGRGLGLSLPDDDAIQILAIEAADVLTFGEGCASAVAAAIPQAAGEVMAALQMVADTGAQPPHKVCT